MTKPKRKIAPLLKPRRVLPEGWTVGTLAQWLPVVSVAVGGIIWLTRLQDAVQSLQGNANQVQVTQLEDRIATVEKEQDKAEVKESNDFAEAKANDVQIWAYVGRGKEGAKP